jgi:hypothetical protein
MRKLSPFIFLNQTRNPVFLTGAAQGFSFPEQRDRKAYKWVRRRRKPAENAAHREKDRF